MKNKSHSQSLSTFLQFIDSFLPQCLNNNNDLNFLLAFLSYSNHNYSKHFGIFHSKYFFPMKIYIHIYAYLYKNRILLHMLFSNLCISFNGLVTSSYSIYSSTSFFKSLKSIPLHGSYCKLRKSVAMLNIWVA